MYLKELKLFARLLKAFIDASDKTPRNVAKKWLDIVEAEITTAEELRSYDM